MGHDRLQRRSRPFRLLAPRDYPPLSALRRADNAGWLQRARAKGDGRTLVRWSQSGALKELARATRSSRQSRRVALSTPGAPALSVHGVPPGYTTVAFERLL